MREPFHHIPEWLLTTIVRITLLAVFLFIVDGGLKAQPTCCKALASVEDAARKAMIDPPEPGNLGTWRSNLTAQLDKIRRGECSAKSGQTKLDALVTFVNSLTYVDGSNPQYVRVTRRRMKFARILIELDSIKTLYACVDPSLGGASKVKTVCGPGTEPKTPIEDEPVDFTRKKIDDAIKDLQAEAKKIEGTGGPVAGQIDKINGRMSKLKQAKGYWDQIKAASCLPPKVLQSMRQVANDLRTAGHSANCLGMCNALAEWYEKLLGRDKSFERKIFTDTCLANCP